MPSTEGVTQGGKQGTGGSVEAEDSPIVELLNRRNARVALMLPAARWNSPESLH
jgi:hypothetical protein